MMKRKIKPVLCAAAISALGSQSASAMVLVWDIPNFFVNKMNLKANKKREEQLEAIRHQLSTKEGDTVNHYTSISADIDQTNIKIDADFTWIINEGEGGNEVIPIPAPVKDFFKNIVDADKSEDFIARYRDARDYKEVNPDDEAGFEGSRARKVSNDMWVKSIESHQENLATDAKSLADLISRSKPKGEEMGHAKQMQIANAIAQSQVNQLIKLRSMLLVSEAARVAESQAAADKEARALATSARLRAGLKEASSSYARPQKTTRVDAF
ncbi:hypothetical protein L2Y94_00695 [Luteibacter aegosomatis]|uniref:hypothetical protein n=1 Tax=Luteibacter aegosomatis TaxID=2911537 RepID=UPI001FF88BAB|nr:hypothetical protein [Luteibacter aegosomatis]UPG85916.1 hypothetical protein L2Y94_00695 [Luteibacter aegosomatis]